MFIEDEELRNLFISTSAEHIQTIEEGLLHLEKHPQDFAHLDSVLRSTHSLKGDSRMVGVLDVEQIVHQVEEILQEVKKGERKLESQLFDRLYQGLDATRKIVSEATSGESSNIKVFDILSMLMHDSDIEAKNYSSDLPAISSESELDGLFDTTFDNSELVADVPEVSSSINTVDGSTSAYIEDDEFRELFKNSSAEHIQIIEDGLLYLEKQPQDLERLELVLRSTHSLKGDARMLGVLDVESIVHQIEENLQEIQKGTVQITPEFCERIYVGIDAVRKISLEAVTGEPSNIQVFFILAQLMETNDEHDASSNSDASDAVDGSTKEAISADMGRLEQEWMQQLQKEEEEKVAQREKALAATPSQIGGGGAESSIDTIRVPAAKLDTLVAQIAELSVTRSRFAGRLGELDSLNTLYEEWQQQAIVGRAALDELEKRLPGSELHRIRNFYLEAETYLEQLGGLATQLRQTAYEDTARLEIFSNQIETNIQNLRLLPLSTVFNLFPRMVRDIAKQQGKQIQLIIEGEDTLADKQILEEIKDPLIHLIRNAIDHGLESPSERLQHGKSEHGTIRLRGFQVTDSIGIELRDDGRGLDLDGIRKKALNKGLYTDSELQGMSEEDVTSLIFSSGFSTRDTVSELSGRGVGLDVVRSNIEKLKGSIQVESNPGEGCIFRITVNPSLAKTYSLLVAVNDSTYAIPAEAVHSMMMLSPMELFGIEGHQTTTYEGKPLSVSWLTDLLGLQFSPLAEKRLNSAAQSINCVVLQVGNERLGILVDQLIDRQSIVIKKQNRILRNIRNVAGATILGNGEVCIVINPGDLISTARGSITHSSRKSDAVATTQRLSSQKSILLVEDSIIIRTQMIRLLEGAGYAVVAAVDGQDALGKLPQGSFDAVVSDVEMPNMDGLSMTAKIRQNEVYDELPIVLLTTLASESDRRRGAEAGANAYLTKGDFDQGILFETLNRFI